MITSGVPPSRLSSFINYTNDNGITCRQSYYTLIDSNEERYQFSIPVTWSTNSVSIEHYYNCRVKLGGLAANESSFINALDKSTSIKGIVIV